MLQASTYVTYMSSFSRETQTHAHLIIATTKNYRGTIIPSSPPSHSARQKKLRSSQSGCTEPTRRDRKSSSRWGILAGGQLTSQERTDRCVYTHTHTHEKARCLPTYHTCNDPVNLNLCRSCSGSRRGRLLQPRLKLFAETHR